MKLASALAVALALATSAVAATPASAFTPGPPFVLKGPITFTRGFVSLSCTGTFNVQPSGAGDAIVSVNITSGGGSGLTACPTFVASGLPWALTTTPTTVTFSPTFNFLGPCGPGTITGTWNNASPGTLAIHDAPLPPNCRISAFLSASPAQTLP